MRIILAEVLRLFAAISGVFSNVGLAIAKRLAAAADKIEGV
jgi:hypothetical protein